MADIDIAGNIGAAVDPNPGMDAATAHYDNLPNRLADAEKEIAALKATLTDLAKTGYGAAQDAGVADKVDKVIEWIFRNGGERVA